MAENIIISNATDRGGVEGRGWRDREIGDEKDSHLREGKERERQRETETERQKQRQTERERERERDPPKLNV